MRAVFGVERRRSAATAARRPARDPQRQRLAGGLRAFAARDQGAAVTAGRFVAKLRDRTDELLAAEIAERRADPDLAERDDILSMLVSAEFDDGTKMSDPEIRDQLMTLLLAGHETTATALAWTFDLLLHQPAALERLEAELETASTSTSTRSSTSRCGCARWSR